MSERRRPSPDEGDSAPSTGRARFRAGAGRPPFAHLRPVLAAAVAYAVAALAWAVVGEPLPGGRWAAVHLFTLGTLTNLVAAMTEHFARTLTRAATDEHRTGRLLTLNAGALLTLVGLVAGWPWAFATGAGLATVAVLWLYRALRRMRTRATGARFGYVVRAYEHACAAFVLGAILGALLGTGLVGGPWYSAARLAHLTVTVLGWGGLVLLATVVFFAPTLMRTQMAPGTERLAVPALRYGTGALALAVVALALTAAPGAYGVGARGLAAVGLAGYAAAATAVCWPVLRASRKAVASPHAHMIAAACAWFPLVAWAGVVVAAAGRDELLDALGLVLLVGVLGQAIVASVAYLVPMATGGGPAARAAERHELDRWPLVRAGGWNLAVVLLAAGVALPRLTGLETGALVVTGWVVIAGVIGAHLGLGAAALRAGRDADAAA